MAKPLFLRIVFPALIAFLSPIYSRAETIVLKSGQQIEGQIVEKTDKYVKVIFQDMPITYYLDEIKSIDGNPSVISNDKGQEEKNPAVRDPAKEKIIKDILELSGFKKQIESLPAFIPETLENYKNKVKPEIFDALSKALYESYKFETIYQVVFDNLLSNFDQARYSRLLEWLNSPLSLKMSQLEVQASTQEAFEGMKKFASGLKDNPPAKERIALMRGLDEATEASETYIKMVVVQGVQIIKALETAVPEEKRIKEANWEEKFESGIRANLEQSAKESILLSFLYTYQSVSDQDLAKYIEFWNSEEGRWSNKILINAFLDAVAKVGRDMGNNLARYLSSATKAAN